MDFIDRSGELRRLNRLAANTDGGLAVVYGRRRIGKTRLLLEWSSRLGGLYTVADQSAAEVQRHYFAAAVARHIPGFSDLRFGSWRGLLDRLARDAPGADFRGPVIFDELPYLVIASPELPSVLQRWVDHEARSAGLVVAVAGSSQRMMQGVVLARDAPLFGRAREILSLGPIPPTFLAQVFPTASSTALADLYIAWGGVPRYWELAALEGGSIRNQIDRIILDPLGPLHREPDRLLLEEVPSAMEARPLLDAIGAGAHRVSEIGGRLGRSATSMSRPLAHLVEMGIVRREVPFGESEKKSRRALYRIDDPFFRLWFRVVAPNRGLLATCPRSSRLELLDRFWRDLAGQGWEQLCRERVPFLDEGSVAEKGPWGPATRWWRAAAPEWDIVSASIDGKRLLLGESKWSSKTFRLRDLERLVSEVAARRPPQLPGRLAALEIVRAIFVPEAVRAPPDAEVALVTAEQLVPLSQSSPTRGG